MTTIDTLVRWDLTPLLDDGSPEGIDRLLQQLSEEVETFRARHVGRISHLPPDQLATVMTEYERLLERLIPVQVYAELLFAQDSSDPGRQVLSQKVHECANGWSRQLLFMEHELTNADDDSFQRFLAAETLSPLRHYLTALRRFRPHTLPEREEQLLKEKALTGIDAFCRLFDELSSSYRFRFTLDGEEREMTGEELLSLLHHPDPTIRERSFTLFLDRHRDDRVTYGAIFNTVALHHRQEREMRGYSGGPLSPTNLANELSDDTVTSLLDATEEAYPLARRYFRLKKTFLGLDPFKNTDIYAPTAASPRRYTLEEARRLVDDAYRSFSPDFARIVDSFFVDRRIDTHPAPGKSGGAFCMGASPSIPPYILLNFTGTLRDVSTLAHEAGHGIHFVLSSRQRFLNYHPPLPLAETASVFGEMLLTRRLLESTTDRGEQRSILAASIEDIIATTMRQVVLTRFEERLHREREEGLVTVERIGDIWMEENGKLFGDVVEPIPSYSFGWSYISHFVHSRFYCYSYTCAELIVLALFRSWLDEGERFIPAYSAILERGGSASPEETLSLAGITLDRPFWQKGYTVLEALIDRFESLL
ncbi:MAG: M3 family oligoendopeptidase [Desulfuromonadia bacterium]